MLEITPERKAELEEPYAGTFWGQPVTVERCVIDAHLGDGQRLLGVTTINSRPSHYLIRVDSTWQPDFRTSEAEDYVADHIEEILEAIENEVGPAVVYNDDGEREEEKLEFPALDDENGTAWWDDTDLLQVPSRNSHRHTAPQESAETEVDGA